MDVFHLLRLEDFIESEWSLDTWRRDSGREVWAPDPRKPPTQHSPCYSYAVLWDPVSFWVLGWEIKLKLNICRVLFFLLIGFNLIYYFI